jgi:hypothetical protein
MVKAIARWVIGSPASAASGEDAGSCGDGHALLQPIVNRTDHRHESEVVGDVQGEFSRGLD